MARLARLTVVVRLRLECETPFQGLSRPALAYAGIVVRLGLVMTAPTEIGSGRVAVWIRLPMRPLLAVIVEPQEGGTG